MSKGEFRVRLVWTLVSALGVFVLRAGYLMPTAVLEATPSVAQAVEKPRPVRNDVAKPGRELLVLRHHQLRRRGHDEFYRLSSQDVWPFFERNGARAVGQWRIVESDHAMSSNSDDVYRLARYASFQHWQATRSERSSGAASVGGGGADVGLGGNGPARERSISGFGTRGELEVGSKGAYFLEGWSAPGGPYFMPGLDEQYELLQSGQRPGLSDAEIPVRLDVAQLGAEIVEVRYQRIRKDTYERFVDATRAAVWPWEEKLGARPIGQWRVVYPSAPNRTSENSAYDEVISITRYASRAHRDAMQPEVAVFMGGNGPDFVAWKAALRTRENMTLATSVELAEGSMYQSPPKFLPALPERYRLIK